MKQGLAKTVNHHRLELSAFGIDTWGVDFGLLDRAGSLIGNPLSILDLPTNMHCHTFFSFNGYGLSPTSLAWLAKRHQINLMGIVDFDVLDSTDEFLAACDIAEVFVTSGLAFDS